MRVTLSDKSLRESYIFPCALDFQLLEKFSYQVFIIVAKALFIMRNTDDLMA